LPLSPAPPLALPPVRRPSARPPVRPRRRQASGCSATPVQSSVQEVECRLQREKLPTQSEGESSFQHQQPGERVLQAKQLEPAAPLALPEEALDHLLLPPQVQVSAPRSRRPREWQLSVPALQSPTLLVQMASR
jgi:hypothetical protein